MKFNKTIIGMLHVPALVGTPKHNMSWEKIIDHVKRETEIYQNCGINTLILENMHDVPYTKCQVGAEIVAGMAVLAYEIKRSFSINLGIQILAGANKEALACALMSGADFIRAEGYVFAHVADEGFIDGCAGELLRYRKQLSAEHVAILADIKKKHSSHAVTADVSIEETAETAQFFLADGVIVTGSATSKPADLAQLKAVKKCVSIPVLVGSGITAENVQDYLMTADGLIIGSYFKENGYWANPLSSARIKEVMSKVANEWC